MSNSITTTVYDVLDPISAERRSLRWQGGRLVEVASSLRADGGREIDGSGWWILPALYDADAHMPHVPFGVRVSDLHRALAGGVAQMNVALPWQLARGKELKPLVADTTRSKLPRLIPLLAVMPSEDSGGFADWLPTHVDELTTVMPGIVKLYSMDPNFEANLEAVLKADLTPMVWNDTEEALAKLTAHVKGPMHLRHATSAGMVSLMQRAANATLQTSPHFLLSLAPGRRGGLSVLPTPPSDRDRHSLTDAFLEQVDVIASDHVAPQIGDPTGPGLQTQQHFLSALLTLCEQNDWPLDRVFDKATKTPARIFDVETPDGFVLVEPNEIRPVEAWPRQGADRAPFLGLDLKGRVLVVALDGMVELV